MKEQMGIAACQLSHGETAFPLRERKISQDTMLKKKKIHFLRALPHIIFLKNMKQ